MMRYCLLICLSFICVQLFSQPTVCCGTVKRFEQFSSKYVQSRNIDVWLPDGYSSKKKYAVLYMHDGQMLFDSTSNWNKQEWGVDETMTDLLKKKKIQDCIVVGIWNTGVDRHRDYFPQKPFEILKKQEQDTLYSAERSSGQIVFSGTIHSDNYLKFLVKELKPFIDSAFSTRKDRNHTFIMGSSMGGLISMYAICEYPDIFGGAACLSTHWPGIFRADNNPAPAAFLDYFGKHVPAPAGHRIYFDHGSATLDSMYAPYQEKADSIMRKKGYTSSNWTSLFFKGEEHSERAWKRRLHIPLAFLLRK